MSCTMTETKTKKKTQRGNQSITISVDPMTGLPTPPVTPTEVVEASGSVVTGQESPIAVVVNGTPYTSTDIASMGRILSRARVENEFPTTTTPGYNVQAMIDDYTRLMQLRQLRVGLSRSEWITDRAASEYLVAVTRDIRERDETLAEEAATANVEARVGGMMNGVQAESTMYQLIRHAVHSVLQTHDVQQAGANSGVDMAAVVQDVDRRLNELTATHEGVSAIMTQMRNMVQPHIRREIAEAPGVDMESVFEDIFATIERSLLDATGPLRLNINRMNGQINNMEGQINHVDGQIVQLNAITGHARAIEGHVQAMGTNLNSMGTLLNSTNGNITAITSQVGLLQTIIPMLPQMIVQAIQQVLPEILNEAIGGAINDNLVNSLQAFVGAMNNVRTQAASPGKSASGNKKNGKKGGFMNKFFGIFKKNDRDDGHGPSGSGRGMAA
ncbi:hypothetical protein F5X96DRAFT_691515 [Biscogniauxia mediterranea]|nr:hypothetical protein F5X96DRAFT_691515 [Biscogniauxia mediterranea]